MEDSELAAMYAAGLNLDEVARRTGASRRRVREAILTTGGTLRTPAVRQSARKEPRPADEGPLDPTTLARLRRQVGLL